MAFPLPCKPYLPVEKSSSSSLALITLLIVFNAPDKIRAKRLHDRYSREGKNTVTSIKKTLSIMNKFNDALKRASSLGFITLDELNNVLPPDILTGDQIDDVYELLTENNIDVIDLFKSYSDVILTPVLPDINTVVPNMASADKPVFINRIKGKPNILRRTIPIASNYVKSNYAYTIGNRAEEIVCKMLDSEMSKFRIENLRWVSKEGEKPGWDIELKYEDGRHDKIEVKGTGSKFFPSIELTANEWFAASTHRSSYWLYLVTNCLSDNPSIQKLQDPFSLVEEGTFTLTPVLWRFEMIQK